MMITESELHAFVDNQLGSQERLRVLEAICKSQRLADQLARLLRLKQLVRCAYQDDADCAPPDAQPCPPGRSGIGP